MKKLLLLTAAAVSLFATTNAATFPELEVFNVTYDQESKSLEPMTFWASESTPTDAFKQYFPSGGWTILTFNSGETFALSCSTFTEGVTVAANAGLVTPKVTLPTDGGILSFTAINWNPTYTNRNNEMKVYVSTTGNSKEDFAEENLLKAYRITADSKTSGPTVSTYEISLSDYAGQDVYIAFVNTGMNAGALGLNNFNICRYKAELDINAPSLVTSAGECAINASVKIRTAVECKGFKAELLIGGEVKSEYNSTRTLNTAYNTYSFAFPDKLSLELGDVVDYTVRVTPNYENAPAISLDGKVSCAEGFPAMIVEEELTGVGCGFCPLAAAWMNYFTDKYPDRFIGVALHAGTYASGVMTSPTYAVPAHNGLGVTGYPFGSINRKAKVAAQYLPDVNAQVQSLLDSRSIMTVEIDNTYINTESGRIDVTFTPKSCVNLANLKYTAAVALLEDGMHGPADKNDSEAVYWAQNNYYSGLGTTQLSNYGVNSTNFSELRPYYEVYTKADAHIFGCVFDHVGLGAWPNWNGKGNPLDSEFNVDAPKSYTISFDIPGPQYVNLYPHEFVGVQNIENTSVVVFIFDANGEIVAASKMKYADFKKITNSVENVATSTMSAFRSGDAITVKGGEGTVAEIFAADGSLLGRKVFSGEATIAPLSYHGLVIVRLSNGTDTYFNKIIL